MNIAIIPARGNSVRVPRKNVRDFRGKPMLRYPIDVAKASNLFQLVVVSTDDDEIEQVALDAGAVVTRRASDDGSKGTQEIARDVLSHFKTVGMACVVYPCSPLLSPSLLQIGRASLNQWRPFSMSVDDRDQDAGCYYFGWRDAFMRKVPLEDPLTARVRLPAERVCDINTPADWARAESMYDALRRAPCQ